MTTPVPFDEDFLGPTTPMPSRPGLIELPYMHFTVSMDPNRRLAAVTAVNIDGSRLRAVARGDNWRLDDRLPADQQAGPELYSNNDLDRGHLVRRRDPVWGPQEVAERANSDTFHYTVCAPQTSTLNQSMTLWPAAVLQDRCVGTGRGTGRHRLRAGPDVLARSDSGTVDLGDGRSAARALPYIPGADRGHRVGNRSRARRTGRGRPLRTHCVGGRGRGSLDRACRVRRDRPLTADCDAAHRRGRLCVTPRTTHQ